MKLQDFTNQMQTIKKGTYHTIKYGRKDTKTNYYKETTLTVRFVDYYNIESVKANGKQPNQNQNPNVQTIIPHILTFNTKTNNYLVHCYPTNNHKPCVVYKDNNDNIIDKATYENVVKPKPHNPNQTMVVFQVKLQDLISID